MLTLNQTAFYCSFAQFFPAGQSSLCQLTRCTAVTGVKAHLSIICLLLQARRALLTQQQLMAGKCSATPLGSTVGNPALFTPCWSMLAGQPYITHQLVQQCLQLLQSWRLQQGRSGAQAVRGAAEGSRLDDKDRSFAVWRAALRAPATADHRERLSLSSPSGKACSQRQGTWRSSGALTEHMVCALFFLFRACNKRV